MITDDITRRLCSRDKIIYCRRVEQREKKKNNNKTQARSSTGILLCPLDRYFIIIRLFVGRYVVCDIIFICIVLSTRVDYFVALHR